MAARQATAREQTLELLKEDHKHVRKHLRDFDKLDAQSDPQACQQLAMRICDELEAHAQLEEELFYPAAREALAQKSEDGMIDEAVVEHASLKHLIAELRELAPDDPQFKAHMTVLSEYVKHHVKEEEGEMFEQLGRAKIAWDSLLPDMQQRHQALWAEKGLTDDNEPDVSEAMHASRSGGARGASTGTRSSH